MLLLLHIHYSCLFQFPFQYVKMAVLLMPPQTCCINCCWCCFCCCWWWWSFMLGCWRNGHVEGRFIRRRGFSPLFESRLDSKPARSWSTRQAVRVTLTLASIKLVDRFFKKKMLTQPAPDPGKSLKLSNNF